jgi:malate/lactate dehydrogenase
VNVTIVGGGGGVGSATAFSLLLLEDAHDVVIVDRRPEMVASHVMDLEQVLEQGCTGTVRGGELGDIADADVVVISASAPLTVSATRLVYLLDNARIVEEIGRAIAARGRRDAVVLLVTNPVDPLCTMLQRVTGLDRHRVLGYTYNDSLRFRTGIAESLGARPGSTRAWVVGEHGDGLVTLADRVDVDGDDVQLTEEQRSRAEGFLRTWYARHVSLDSGRSSTWTSGLGVARMVQAIARDTGETWPASAVLAGEYGIEGVAVGVPLALGREGARHILEWPLAPDELAALRRSADLVREAAERIAATTGS